MSKVKDLTNQRFGRLIVIEQHGFTKPNKHGRRYAVWYCKCDCGNTCEVSSSNLGKSTKSCGCLAKEHLVEMSKGNITHGMAGTHLYRCYHQMLNRCYRTNNDHYHMYGGRGISVCDEWSDYLPFAKWARKNGYADNLTIDRIDTDGDYEPNNCRWATFKEQQNNKRNNHIVEYKGKRYTLAQLAEKVGIGKSTLRERLKMGWSVNDAVEKPVRARMKGADDE